MLVRYSIVVGAVNGYFVEVFQKISKLHAKNSFSFSIVLGDLFAQPTSDDESNLTLLLNGDIKVPLPTYFTLGKQPLPQRIVEKLETSDDEICPNLYFLGKRSTTKTSEDSGSSVSGACWTQISQQAYQKISACRSTPKAMLRLYMVPIQRIF